MKTQTKSVEVLQQLTFSQMIEKIQALEKIISSPKTHAAARIACQQFRDRLYNRCVAKIDNVLSDGAFSIFLSLENSSITINP